MYVSATEECQKDTFLEQVKVLFKLKNYVTKHEMWPVYLLHNVSYVAHWITFFIF